MNNFFDNINDGVRNVETSFVNFISAIAPWLAPLAPAYMTYSHAIETLKFPLLVALSVAVVVEILGFSAISTFVSFWFFNQKNKAVAKKAPVMWVAFAFLFYLSLIVTSNVLLDAFDNAEWAVNSVRALFALQTIPAAVIVIARAGHRTFLSEFEKEKGKKKEKSERKVSENLPENLQVSSDWRQARKQLKREEVEKIARMSSGDIAYLYGVSERTAVNWRGYAQKELQNMG